jgi:hypothetical protein
MAGSHDHLKKKKKTWGEVKCEVHGKGKEKTLRVPLGNTKFERLYRGCPYCIGGK